MGETGRRGRGQHERFFIAMFVYRLAVSAHHQVAAAWAVQVVHLGKWLRGCTLMPANEA